jgi:hypothetical protein
MGAHLIDGEFQSDKYPTTPRGKVPLSVKDITAQDLLWEYAQRRRFVDEEFSDDLETALVAEGFVPAVKTDAEALEAYERSFYGHGRGQVVTQPLSGQFVERAMTAGELAARAPARIIADKIYEIANRAAFAYVRTWRIIADAIDAALVPAREQIRTEILNTPETSDFITGIAIEARHQRERWGSDHDAGKTAFDWFWLIGYLAQKAADASVRGDSEKAKHHTISTAAALSNWHAAMSGGDNRMRPGIAAPQDGG